MASDVSCFSAELSLKRHLAGNFVRFKSQGYTTERSRKLLYAQSDERYFVSCQLSAVSCQVSGVTQSDHRFQLVQGDVCVSAKHLTPP